MRSLINSVNIFYSVKNKLCTNFKQITIIQIMLFQIEQFLIYVCHYNISKEYIKSVSLLYSIVCLRHLIAVSTNPAGKNISSLFYVWIRIQCAGFLRKKYFFFPYLELNSSGRNLKRCEKVHRDPHTGMTNGKCLGTENKERR